MSPALRVPDVSNWLPARAWQLSDVTHIGL